MKHETPTISAQTRPRVGSRHSQRLRNAGRLPAIIYGHKTDPVAVSVDEKEILTILHHGAHVMMLDIEGGSTETCLVKDLQFGFLGDNVIHVDFTRVNLDEEVTVQVHLNFVGEPASATKTGAILRHDLTELEVICRVSDIPEEIRVDISEMETSFTAGEIELPASVKSAVADDTLVAHVTFVHAEEEAVGEEAEIDASAEPEVITESKAGDDEEGEAKE